MARSSLFVLFAAGLVALGVSACESNVDSRLALVGLSANCHINSDCDSPLICAFQRCHEACAANRDCSAGARCVAGESPRHVCQLESERACSESQSCPGTELCGIDAQCRDACQSDRDCVAEQVCSGGTCAAPDELDQSGKLTPDPDRPASLSTPCLLNSDCPGSLICDSRSCRSQCAADVDCHPGYVCSGSVCRAVPAPTPECEYNSDCASGERCIAEKCQPLPPAPLCEYSSECSLPGQHCVGGQCVCECASDADCSNGQICDGSCACIDNKVLSGDIVITNSTELQRLNGVVEVKGSLTFMIGIHVGGEYRFPSLRKVAALQVVPQSAPPGTTSAPVSYLFDALTEVTGALDCRERCALPALRYVDSLSIQGDKIPTLELPLLESAEKIEVHSGGQGNSTVLDSISFPALLRAQTFDISSNDALTTLSAPRLASVETLSVVQNQRLITVDLAQASPAQTITVLDNPKLAALALPGAEHLAAELTVRRNAALATLSLPNLLSSGPIMLDSLPSLKTLNLTALSQVTGDITIMLNSSLPQCTVDALGQSLLSQGWLGTLWSYGNRSCTCAGAVCR